MVKANIHAEFNHQYCVIENFTDNIFVADYTEQTRLLPIKKDVEFFSSTPPTDIKSFCIKNENAISIDGIKFNNLSFVYSCGRPKSQCEAVFFPSVSASDSWVLFCELKYSFRPRNNENNLRKAILQLYKTRCHYILKNVISSTNKAYLIASLPMQPEPFPNFSLTPAYLLNLRRKKNIILRLKNEVEIVDDKRIAV